MTGLDGLIAARKNQISSIANRTSIRRMPGQTASGNKPDTGWDSLFHTLSIPEEIMAKAVANVAGPPREERFRTPIGTENFAQQVGFADLFRESGMSPAAAAVLGITVAIANPLDPLNKFNVGGLTKVGKAAQAVKTGKLVGSPGKYRLSAKEITDRIARDQKLLDSGKLLPQNVKPTQRSLARSKRALRDNEELNGLLAELQKRNIDISKLEYGKSVYEQVRQGQRNLLGFTSPFKLDQLALVGFGSGTLRQLSRGPTAAVDVMPLMPAKMASALIKGATNVGEKIFKPIGQAAYKAAGKLGIPTIGSSVNARRAALSIKHVLDNTKAQDIHDTAELENLIRRFIADNPQSAPLLEEILQGMEWKHAGAKEIAIKELEKAAKVARPIPGGAGVAVSDEPGLTREQKLAITQSGVAADEIPTAIGQFEKANVDSVFLGSQRQHEAKLLGRYIVVKSSDAKVALRDLDDLDGIYGNRAWAKHQKEGSTYLVQKRMPSSQRIRKTTDFTPDHLDFLVSLAAQLSRSKKTLVDIKPEDLLVTPQGAVQIVNPSIIETGQKSQRAAVDNSRSAIEGLLNELDYPQGAAREMHHLKNSVTANRVPRGVDGLTFRKLEASSRFNEAFLDHNAADLMEEAANMEGYKDVIRAAYDEITPQQLAQSIGDPRDFERANQIEFFREKIRNAHRQGLPADIEPIAVARDYRNNLHLVGDGSHASLTAAILEGLETVPVYKRNFIGDVIDSTKGHYVGPTHKLAQLWNPFDDSSAINLPRKTRDLVADNYSLVSGEGIVTKLADSAISVHEDMAPLLNRMLTMGPEFVGRARAVKLNAATQILETNFGSMDNALMFMADVAEKSDAPTFIRALWDPKTKTGMLKNINTGNGIDVNNMLANVADTAETYRRFKAASTLTLDKLATDGVLTRATINQNRRVMLASASTNSVVRILDPKTSTLKVMSNSAGTKHLQTVAESFINKSATAADVEPYARIQLFGSDGTKALEVKDLVRGSHPKLLEVMEPKKIFQITPEQAKDLRKKGVEIATPQNIEEVGKRLQEKGMTVDAEGKGVLVKEKNVPVRGPDGQFSATARENIIVRPEYAFFVTPSGAIAVGTRHKNVADLLESVFGEGPAFFREMGVMTTGKVVMSDPTLSRIKKLGIGEMRQYTGRLKELAKNFSDLGLQHSTVMDIHVPFDDAVWRSIYGERVTIGQILDDKFKLKIPDELLNHTPDIRVHAPGRFSIDDPVGVVALEKTRLHNKKLQDLMESIEGFQDELFIRAAKAGLPIHYYESWIGRHLTDEAKTAMREFWIKHPDKESKTFKHMESILQGRLVTDLTTLEFNAVLRRLQKEGVEGAESVISDVVKSIRDGYIMKPTPSTARSLSALAQSMPEGLKFFHTDPIYAAHLSARKTNIAVGRQQIVDSLESDGVALWSGTIQDLQNIKITRNQRFVKLEKQLETSRANLGQAREELKALTTTAPDVKGKTEAQIRSTIQSEEMNIAKAEAEQWKHMENLGKGKVMDTMVDPESEQVWLRGEDLTRLVDDGVIDPSDIVGDPSDAFVRVPVKKYQSLLDKNGAKVFLFPKEVAGAVQRYFGTTTKDGFGRFLSIWDQVHQIWRNWTLFPIPAYHARNMVSNFFMAYLGGVTDPNMYAQSHTLMELVDNFRKGKLSKKAITESLGAVSFTSASGEVVSGQQIWDEFVRRGGLTGGLHRNEFTAFGTLARASEFDRISVKAGLRGSSELAGSWLYDNSLLRGGLKVAAWTENRFRLATFIDAFTKGRVERQAGTVLSGFDAAGIHMKRVFYDYSDLSAFERGWLRRVLPFYSWSRHNVPRMLSTLVTDPIKHYRMAEFFHELEMGLTGDIDIRETQLPKWVRDRYGLIVNKTDNGNYVVKTGEGLLPMMDGYKAISGSGIAEMIKDGFTPFVKTPIEQLANYSFYSGRQIERVPGQRSSSGTLSSLGFSRRATTEGPMGVLNLALNDSVFRTFFRPGGEFATKVLDPIFHTKETDSFSLGLFALVLGKAYTIDPQRARAFIYQDWTKRRQQIVALRNGAANSGDVKSVEDADRMLTWLDLQYPGRKEP